jgi:rhomboid protease GluP
MCPNCRAFITVDDKVCPYCDLKLGPPAIERRSPPDILGGLIPHARFTTMMILLLNTGLYLAMLLRSSKGSEFNMDLDGRTLYEFGAKFGPAIYAGQWWRLITAGFLHGGILHILMNSWALFDLGVQVEETYGTSRYLVLYFATNITGFFASMLWAPGTLSIGASAAIFGLIGAMIALGLRDRSAWGAQVRAVYSRWAMYGLLFGLLSIFGIGINIDNAAHMGGLAGGFALGFVAGRPGYSLAIERIWQVAAAICIIFTAYAFGQVFLRLLADRGI